MSSNKTTDFLKECMADALFGLMKKKPFAKITINEIAEAAGVNRSTWFRNFDAKTDALTFKLVTLWNRWEESHLAHESKRFTVDHAVAFFAFNASIRDILEIIYQAEQQPCVYDAFYQMIMPQCGANPIGCYEARFYSFGLFGLLDEWVKRGFYEKPEELAVLFRRMMSLDSQKDIFIETQKQKAN